MGLWLQLWGLGAVLGGCDPALPHLPGSLLVLSAPRATWTSMTSWGPLSSDSVAMAPTRCWSHITTRPTACPTLSPPDPVWRLVKGLSTHGSVRAEAPRPL